jgi:hypothetical protein
MSRTHQSVEQPLRTRTATRVSTPASVRYVPRSSDDRMRLRRLEYQVEALSAAVAALTDALVRGGQDLNGARGALDRALRITDDD